jgi:hypothetical protein
MNYREVRINTAIGVDNQYINFKLEQEFDNINILSIKLTQSDVYNNFNADYGCIVGRVIANGGVGVPNVRISVFIPLSEEDELNDDIRAIYPYKTVNDTNIEGYKYNLLPRVSQISPYLGNYSNENNIGYSPKTPVGTFPTKEEILTNDVLLEVYKKYYKFSTITNESGDYMIFGVPVGTHTVHMSADITDIGKYSMSPSTMVKLLGVSPDLFDNNGTTIRRSSDLDDLPNVQIQNISVDVRPFWGDSANFEIGITRQDFKIKSKLSTSFVVFGSMMTMGKDGLWGIKQSNNCGEGISNIIDGNQCMFYTINREDSSNYNIENFRLPKPITEIYTIRNAVSDNNINSNSFNINTDIVKLSKTEYVEYVDNGMFTYIIPCNRKKIITNEFGLPEEVSNTNPNGIFTEFNGYFLMDSEDLQIDGDTSRTGLNGDKGPFIKLRGKFKIPQDSRTAIEEFLKSNSDEDSSNQRFIKKNRKFLAGEFYTVSQFYNISYGYDGDKLINSNLSTPKNNTLGIIQVREKTTDEGESFIRNTNFPSNSSQNTDDLFFGSQWLNMTLFQIQFAASDRKRTPRTRVSRFLLDEHNSSNMHFINDNTQNLGGGRFNSKGFLTAKYHYFDFVNIKRDDIIKMSTNPTKKIYRSITDGLNTESTYKYGSNNSILKIEQSNLGGNIVARDFTTQQGAFIYKGLFQSDCIEFIKNLNLI